MKRSRREFSINMAMNRFIFENDQITLFTCFIPSYPKQVWGHLTQEYFLLGIYILEKKGEFSSYKTSQKSINFLQTKLHKNKDNTTILVVL